MHERLIRYILVEARLHHALHCLNRIVVSRRDGYREFVALSAWESISHYAMHKCTSPFFEHLKETRAWQSETAASPLTYCGIGGHAIGGTRGQ